MNWFELERGVRMGCPMPTWLLIFNQNGEKGSSTTAQRGSIPKVPMFTANTCNVN